MNQPEDYNNMTKEITIFGVTGGVAMLARILVSTEKQSIGYVVRRLTAAAIVSVFVGFALQDQIQNMSMRYAAVGLTGAAAPEIIDVALFWVRKRLKKRDPLA
jgi:hypothetical protein